MKNLESIHQQLTKIFMASGKALPQKRDEYLRTNMFKTKYLLYDLDEKKFKAAIHNAKIFDGLDHQEKAKIWSYVFCHTEYLGLGDLAIKHFKAFQNKKSHPLIQYWPILKIWVSKIENWAHGDMLSGLYCDMLSEDPKQVYSELQKWSKAKSPWKNRMAILSLLYYYNPKRNLLPFKQIIALVEPHFKKEHYYLQKAVGWNLRELSRAHPKETEKFVDKNVLRLSATAFTTAMEKIPRERKEKLKLQRRAHRKAR